MTRVLDHLAADYKNIYEFRELSATVSKDLDVLDSDWQLIENDQFILTSSESAIYRREKAFRILPDRKIETLDFRKRRLLVHMQSNPPYVLEHLKNLLNRLLGENKYEIDLDKLLFEMEVLMDVDSAEFYYEAVKTIEKVVPLNIDLTTALLLIREYMVLRTLEYTFPVPYPITGTFHTAPISGVASKATVAAESKEYNFQVPYPITGAFYCTNEK